jgi:PAS domain S-box-containing protein
MRAGLKYSNVVKHINQKDTLQVMYPLWGNASCLVCHSQHFKSSDLIGAGGVEIDMADFLASANKTIQNLLISHVLIWMLGLLGIIIFYRQVKFWINSHLLLENKLFESQANLELRVENRTKELNKLSIAVEGSPAIIIITDSNNIIEYVNPIFTTISGYSNKEILGKSPAKFNSDLNNPAIYRQMWEDLMNKGVWYGEFRNRRKDGSLYWVSSAISSIKSEAGAIQNYIAIQEDITEKKHNEYELIRAKEIAETSSKAKAEFISSMSHELLTPLNAIIGFAELFKYDKTLEIKCKKNAKKIFNAGNHLLKIVNDILDLSKIESAQLDIHYEPFLFTTLIDESIKLISSLAESKNISIIVKKSVRNYTLYADYGRTKQVMFNLLSNAVKYSQDKSEITIDYENTIDSNIRILISDNGIGIEQEKQTNLFEPFNRLGAEQSNIEGTGVGLYICKQLIEMMNGQIGFESNQQTGSIFWIELPGQNINKKKK